MQKIFSSRIKFIPENGKPIARENFINSLFADI